MILIIICSKKRIIFAGLILVENIFTLLNCMKNTNLILKTIICTLFLMYSLTLVCQNKVFTIDVENRNEAIKLNNSATKMINENKYQEATSILIKSVKKDSLLRENYVALFKVAVMSKNTSDSILNCLKKGQRIYNDDDEVCFFIGEIYRLKGQYKEAVNEYNSAIELSKEIPEKSFYYTDFFKSRAFCYSKIKNYTQAILDYNFVLTRKPNDDKSFLNRGICYSNSGKKSNALIDFKKALELGNQDAVPLIKTLSK